MSVILWKSFNRKKISSVDIKFWNSLKHHFAFLFIDYVIELDLLLILQRFLNWKQFADYVFSDPYFLMFSTSLKFLSWFFVSFLKHQFLCSSPSIRRVLSVLSSNQWIFNSLVYHNIFIALYGKVHRNSR